MKMNLFSGVSNSDLIEKYRQLVRERNEVGFFSLDGILAGETKGLIFSELKRRGLELEAAAVHLTENLRDQNGNDIGNLISTLESAKEPGGSLHGFYDGALDPIDEEAEIIENLLWVLHAAAEKMGMGDEERTGEYATER